MFEALIAIALGMCVSAAVPTVGKWKDSALLVTISLLNQHYHGALIVLLPVLLLSQRLRMQLVPPS